MGEIETIQADLESSHLFNRELSKFLHTNFIVNDKTITEWKRYFYIELPEEITFPVLIKKSTEVTKKYQEATFFREKQTVQLCILEQARDNKYNNAYNIVREEHQREFGKNLAADSCKAAATLVVKDIEDAISNQKVVADFWAKTCSTLIETRKHLELIGYALSAEIRAGRDFVFKTGSEE